MSRTFTVIRGYKVVDDSLTDEQISKMLEDNDTDKLEADSKCLSYDYSFDIHDDMGVHD